MPTHQRAAILYCELNQFTKTKVKLIAAILEGETPNTIIKKRLVPNLAVSTIYKCYNDLKKKLND